MHFELLATQQTASSSKYPPSVNVPPEAFGILYSCGALNIHSPNFLFKEKRKYREWMFMKGKLYDHTLTSKTSAFLIFGQKGSAKNFRTKIPLFRIKFRPIFHTFGTYRNTTLDVFLSVRNQNLVAKYIRERKIQENTRIYKKNQNM